MKLKDQHQFTMKGQEWFWIAGIVKNNAFAMLTTKPGPDMEPFHDRQIVTLASDKGVDWLALKKAEADILKRPPAGTLQVRTLRKNGETIADGCKTKSQNPSPRGVSGSAQWVALGR